MRVLLTGYTGLLGRHLARALKKDGHYIRVLLHRSTVNRRDFKKEGDEIVWGSIDEPDVIKEALRNIEWVVHSAWTFNSPTSQRPTINERGTELLFKESVKTGVKCFAFISSVAVYGMKNIDKKIFNESSPLASGHDITFIYPSEKISVENFLHSHEREGARLGVFRPGPIFDDDSGPVKRIFRISGYCIGLGIGNGKNHMGYIHGDDVACAVVKWLKNGKDNVVFNVTPTKCLGHRDWYNNWAKAKGEHLVSLFICARIIFIAAFGIKILKKFLGKATKSDIKYTIACSKRDLCYSNEALKYNLGWTDKVTAKYTMDN